MNLIWEYTQAVIALVVVVSTMAVGVRVGLEGKGDVPQVLTLTMGVVVGFYFSRTNHAAIGGVGPKPKQEYEGR